MLAHPEELRGLARTLRSSARDVDERRDRVTHSVGGLHALWRSPAANFFILQEAPHDLLHLGDVIGDIEEVAAMLERLANELEDRLAEIARIEQRVHSWFWHQPPPVDGTDPVWIREWWRYRPGRFPSHGDSEWLDARSYLKARGVRV